MKRRKRLRADPEKVRDWRTRSRKALPNESAKRRAEREARRAAVDAVLARDGYRCVARDLVPEVTCWGPLDADERASRGVAPGGHLDVDNVQVLCRGHHEWRHANPTEARARGLRVESWERA